MKNLKYIIYLIISFLSITSLVEEEEIAVLFLDEETIVIHPNYSADYSELPENDIIQHIRRYSINKQDAYIKFTTDNPANFIVSLLHPKKISNYFLLRLRKISDEKNFLHLFKLY